MKSRPSRYSAIVPVFLLATSSLLAQSVVTCDRNDQDEGFKFQKVPPPAVNDAATKAEFTLVAGDSDGNGGKLAVLHDGTVPAGPDEPGANFFFTGDQGGRVLVDLGNETTISRVGTYSWHTEGRAPQVYKLYGSNGGGANFDSKPAAGTDPAGVGWQLIADVNTRPQDDSSAGGQYGVAVTGKSGAAVGRYRYLLFDIGKGMPADPFGNTFFSEIDVVDASGPKLEAVKVPEKIRKEFRTMDGRYTFTVDATLAPDLMDWAEKELMPVVETWYPKLVKMLPSPGFTAANHVLFEFRTDMGGTPAYAAGTRVALSIDFFRGQMQGEGKGAVVHEMVHVVQDYWRGRRNKGAQKTPFWVQEGLPDYIRWFLYEPEKHGAEITERNFEKANYDSAYRVSGNFLNYVVNKYDRDLIRKLNQACREGRYTDDLWKQWTRKSIDELNAEWKKYNAQKLGIKMPE